VCGWFWNKTIHALVQLLVCSEKHSVWLEIGWFLWLWEVDSQNPKVYSCKTPKVNLPPCFRLDPVKTVPVAFNLWFSIYSICGVYSFSFLKQPCRKTHHGHILGWQSQVQSKILYWWRVRTTHIPIQVWKWFFMLPPDYCFTKWVCWMLALSPWNMAMVCLPTWLFKKWEHTPSIRVKITIDKMYQH